MTRTFLAALALLGAAAAAPAANWSFWRGPEQNGVSRERDLPETFKLGKPGADHLVFTAAGGGLGGPIVQDGQVYYLSRAGTGPTQQERVVALDAKTGALRWKHDFNVWHTDIVDDRLAFTNMTGDPETGNVYAHLTAGQFVCFDKAGQIVWQRSLTEEFGRVSGYGGRITTPIVDEDKVIVAFINASWGEQTIGGTRIVAFDKKKGHVIWWGSGGQRVKDTYYSTPVVAVIGGVRLILTGGGDGHLHAFKVRTGELAWSYKLEDGGGAVNCSPVVHGDLVYCGHGEENLDNSQGRVVCVDGGKVKDGKPTLVWQRDGIKVKFAAPVLHDGVLMVCDDAGKIYGLDAAKGDRLWRFSYGRNTKGSPVLADGKIYVSDVDSEFHILKYNGKKAPTRLAQVKFVASTPAPVELHGSPAVADGKVYFTTTEQLVCIGKPGHNAKPDAIPAGPKEKPVAPGARAAHLQVVPADITASPGEAVELRALAYDGGGRLIGPAKVEWSRAGIRPPVFPAGMKPAAPAGKPATPPPLEGSVAPAAGPEAKLTFAKMPNGQFGRVVAKMGDLTGEARVRVLPTLPYAQNFAKVPEGRTPGAWVNAAGKFAVVKGPDGTMALSKVNTNPSPLVARANAYITGPNASDYTIECDVYGTKARGKDMPDVGIGACRYNLTLMGNTQELTLGSWDAMPRVEKKVSFPWKERTWYRLKLMASVVDGKGVVKAKVWPKGEKEPEKWTLELEDPVPNTEGAALLFGFANGTIGPTDPGAGIYYADVRITPNKK